MSGSWDAGQVIVRLQQATQQIEDGAAKGLHLAAEHVLGEATKTVPIEEGTLQRSGATDVDPANLQASVYYDTPYAARQHEEMDYHHDSGRTAKWLENAFNAEAGTVGVIIAKTIRGEL